MPCLWFPDTVLQYWSGKYWDSLKDIILPFPFQPFFTHLHWANPSFPQKRENSGEKAWRRRDQPALHVKIIGPAPDWWSLLLGMWGFSRFSFESFWQFFVSLRNDSSPFLCQQVLNSRFGDQVHENFATISKFGRQYESTASQKWLGMIYFVRFFKNLKICT